MRPPWIEPLLGKFHQEFHQLEESRVQQANYSGAQNDNAQNNQGVFKYGFLCRPNDFFKFFFQVLEPLSDSCKETFLFAIGLF